MILFLYMVVLGFSIGLVNPAPVRLIATQAGYITAGDALVALLLIVSFPGYLRQRKRITDYGARSLEVSWALMCVALVISSCNSPAFSTRGLVSNIKFVEGFILYFPTVAIVNTPRRLRAMVVYGAIIAIAGTILTVAQSRYGLTNMFDTPFYDIGAWRGNKQMVGGFARVNLPVSNWVAFSLLVIFCSVLIRWDWKKVVLSGALFVTILLNFARSLWLGLAAGFALQYFCFRRMRLLDLKSTLRFLFIPLAVLIAVYIGSFYGTGELSESVLSRLDEGVYFLGHTSGTWGERIADTEKAFDLWQKAWLFGYGTNYYREIGQWLDMGIAIVLVSSGVVGLLCLGGLFVRSWALGLTTMRLGVNKNSETSVIAGAALVGQVVLMIVYQQWLSPQVAPILAFCGGVCTTLRADMAEEAVAEL